MQVVVPRDEEELVRLRTELELLRQCGYGAGDAFVTAVRAKTQAYEDLLELNAILRDARDPVVADSIARIDAEAPHIRVLVEHEVVQGQAAKIRHDLAEHVRNSDAADAATLADTYEAATPQLRQDSTAGTLPEPETALRAADMSDQSIEEVLQNIEKNVATLQQLVEGSEADSDPHAEDSPDTRDAEAHARRPRGPDARPR